MYLKKGWWVCSPCNKHFGDGSLLKHTHEDSPNEIVHVSKMTTSMVGAFSQAQEDKNNNSNENNNHTDMIQLINYDFTFDALV